MADDEIVVAAEETAISVPEQTVHLVARNPLEMAESRAQLKRFLEEKVRAERNELDDVSTGASLAKSSGWNHASLDRQVVRCKSRVTFYEKVLAAVNAGYTLVPNFPVDLFAIRVTRDIPANVTKETSYAWTTVEAKPANVEIGEGHYVAPQLEGQRFKQEHKDQNDRLVVQHFFEIEDYQDVVFPIVAARPEVMSATAEAMALKVFDAIGICPPKRKGDPLIIGKIYGQKQGWSDRKEISFLLAWHLDLRTL